MAKNFFGKKDQQPAATPDEEKPAAKPAAKKLGKKAVFTDQGACNYNSTINIGGSVKEIICKEGVIETEDPVLADHLRTMFSEKK